MYQLVTYIAHGESFAQTFESEEAADAAFALVESVAARESVVLGARLYDGSALRSTFGQGS